MSIRDGKLVCDKREDCAAPVTHIDDKGFIFCTPHGEQRRAGGYRRCRKLTKAEIAKLTRDGSIASYDVDARRAVPPCLESMGCLCAGHARGNAATDPCDTSEIPEKRPAVEKRAVEKRPAVEGVKRLTRQVEPPVEILLEPGNGTRYDVVLSRIHHASGDRIGIILENFQRGCVVPMNPSADYLAEKLRVGLADAEALLPLVNAYAERGAAGIDGE